MHYIGPHWTTAEAVNDPGVQKHGYFLIWFKFIQESHCHTALAGTEGDEGMLGASHGVSGKEEFKEDDRMFITRLLPWGSDPWWRSQKLNAKETHTSQTPSLYLKRTKMIVRKQTEENWKTTSSSVVSALSFLRT